VANEVFLQLQIDPAYTFKTIEATVNGNTSEMIRVQQYLAGELYPNYQITKNISVGLSSLPLA
jgi:hypothetical protein